MPVSYTVKLVSETKIPFIVASSQGAKGDKGSKWFFGSGAPNPATGVNEDAYTDVVSGDVYEKIGGSWVLQGNMKGPQGIQGVQGEQGDTFKTTSVTSLTINTSQKTLAVDADLAYIPAQDVVIANSPTNWIRGRVNSYNDVTGIMVVDVDSTLGSGTYVSWDVSLSGDSTALGISDFKDLTSRAYAPFQSGVLHGLEITINGGDNSKIDVAAGVGVVLDYYTDVENPTYTIVEFDGATAVTLPNITSKTFTRVYLKPDKTFHFDSDDGSTPEKRRDYILLQDVIHPNQTTIDSITTDRQLCYDMPQAILDFIKKLGPINTGNVLSANGANLQIDKSAGTTDRVFLNAAFDPKNPNGKTNPSQAIQEFLYNYQDGAGGFTYETALTTIVKPNNYDDGSGVVATVPDNFWTIQRFFYFGQSDTLGCAYGQAIYGSKQEAIAALFSENFNLFSEFVTAAFTTALVVKKGATDLSDLTQAEFFEIIDKNSTAAQAGTLELENLVSDMKFTGFQEWFDSGSYYTDNLDNTITVDRGGQGYIKGQPVSWSGNQTTGTLTQYKTNYIYIDSDGVLQHKVDATRTDYENNIMLFEIYRDGTSTVVRDNHPIDFPTATAHYLHNIIGSVLKGVGADIARVTTGTGTLSTDRQIKIVGADAIYDHGIEDTIPDSGGSGITLNACYTNSSGNWVKYANQLEVPMYYNNAGTPTLLSTGPNNNRTVYTIYVSKTDINSSTPTYFAIMDDADYSSNAEANTAISNENVATATGELAKLELAQLGHVIVLNNGSGGYIEQVIVEKSVLGATLIGAQSSSANLITFDTTAIDGLGPLNAGSSTVQQVGEDLDNEPLSFTTVGRPAANTYRAGRYIWNTTTNIPNFSDGTNWRDATGTIV